MNARRNKKRRNLYTPRVFIPVYEEPVPITNVQHQHPVEYGGKESEILGPPHEEALNNSHGSKSGSKKPYPGVKLLKKLAKERRMEEFRARMETLKIRSD